MQQLTNVNYIRCELHTESTYARVAKDAKDQAVTLNTPMKIQDEHVLVDHRLLFQRVASVCTRNAELQNVFNQELGHYPSTMFEPVNAIRPTKKLSSVAILWSSEIAKLPKTVQQVYIIFYFLNERSHI